MYKIELVVATAVSTSEPVAAVKNRTHVFSLHSTCERAFVGG
jgi:hypothetical protein